MSAEVYGIYKRVSSKNQSTEDKHSLSEQERMCRDRIVAAHGVLAEACIYTDVISGEKLERPALEKCLDDARNKKFTRLIVTTVDRFSRDNRLAAYLMVLFDRCGVKVEFLDADDSTEEGRVMLEIRQLFARMEHKRITWRTQTSRRARAKQGKLITGAWPLYGYLWSNPEKGKRDAYVIDPETAPVVRRIFEDVAAGVPMREVVRRLEQEGIQSPGEVIFKRGLWPRGKPHSFFWRRTTMHRMLTNPAYWGEAVAFRTERQSAQRHDEVTGKTKTVYAQKVRQVNPELFSAEWTEEAGHSAIPLPPEVCPPIVSKELAMRVQVVLRRNKAEAAKRSKGNNPALLRGGFIICGYCGEAMYSATTDVKYGPRYYCRRRRVIYQNPTVPINCEGGAFSIQASVIDNTVWEHVIHLMTDEAYLKAAFDKWIEAKEKLKASHQEKIAAIEESIKKGEKKRANLRISLEEQEDEEERAHLSIRLKDLVASIRQMQDERKRLIAEQSVTTTHLDTVSKLIAWGAAARTNLETATIQEKRMVLHFFGIKVRLWRKEHIPRFEIEVGWDGLKEGYQVRFEGDDDDEGTDSGNNKAGDTNGSEGAGLRTYRIDKVNPDSNYL